jgi:hypothetical protein
MIIEIDIDMDIEIDKDKDKEKGDRDDVRRIVWYVRKMLSIEKCQLLISSFYLL